MAIKKKKIKKAADVIKLQVDVFKVSYMLMPDIASLSQHLNSVHRWTVLQLDKRTLKDNPPTSHS